MGMSGWSFYTSDGVLKQGVSGSSLTDADTLDGFDSSDFIFKAGDTMTGALTLPGDPTLSNHASNKAYVDQRLALAGGTMTGDITLSALSDIVLDDSSEITWSDVAISRAGSNEIELSLGAHLSIQQDPSSGNNVARKSYVDNFLPLAGGTLTGSLTIDAGADIVLDDTSAVQWSDASISRSGPSTLSLGLGEQLQAQQDPSAANDLARKSYVDSVASGGVSQLSDLSDVGPLSPADKMVFQYDGTVDNQWEAVNPYWLELSGGTLSGAVRQPVRTITSSDSAVLSSDYTIFVSTPGMGPAVEVTLPTPSVSDAGTTIVVKDTAGNAATWNISLATAGAELIDGQNTAVIAANYGSVIAITDGVDWYII